MAGPGQKGLPVKNGFRIRLAASSDAQAMLAIYAPYILNTPVSFEYEVPTVSSFAKRIESYMEQFPWLVIEKDGEMAGYAYAGGHRFRQAYQWNAETSVYVADAWKQRNIGRALYRSLFTILGRQGYQNLLAGIVLPNPASVSFHEKMGFTHLGTYRHIGYKQGVWHDVGWWEKYIGNLNNPPPTIVPFHEWMHNDEMLIIFAEGLRLIK